jgi:RNA polymerase sigma factor (sigma-70 family)
MEDFNEIYNRYWKQVFNAAYKRLGDIEKSKDITQDVFVQFFRRLKDRPIENIQAYLQASTRNAVFKFLEKQGRLSFTREIDEEIVDARADADERIRNQEFYQKFQVIVEALPDQQKIIFKLRFEEELNSLEIAEKLGISPKTVRNQLGKVLAILRSSLFF